MAAPQNFRSALNGFNREDVVHYIEYLNAKHATELNQLSSELDLARAELVKAEENPQLRAQLEAAGALQAELEAKIAQQEEQISTLEERCAQLENAPAEVPAANPELEERCAALERQLSAALTARAQAEAERDAARAVAAHCRTEQELEAYRRAERTERIARERAEQVYHQANGALAEATVKVDEAFLQIGGLADQVSTQIAQLQDAVTFSKKALADAAVTLYTICPGADTQ